jgi:pyruvate/2-oxoglutarate/acetoin dehydrogenase E1 component
VGISQILTSCRSAECDNQNAGGKSGLFVEQAFDYLDTSIARVSCPDTPVSFSSLLEQEYIPNSNKVIRVVEAMLG